MKKLLSCVSFLFVFFCIFSTQAMASIVITEWMYKGNGGEFFELTNTGTEDIDLTGWYFMDDKDDGNTFDLSSLGTIAAGESVIVTEDDAATFISDWGLDDSVTVLGGLGADDYGNNIGSDDTINIYDATGTLVTTLTYEKDTIKANCVSANPENLDALGIDDDELWILSAVGDEYGSWASVLGDVGNPGTFTLLQDNPVPVPGTVCLLGTGLLGLAGMTRRKRA